MHLASCRFKGADILAARFGEDQLIDLGAEARARGVEFPYRTMVELLAAGALDQARALLDAPRSAPIAQADVEWQPPVRRPGKICGVALNNSASDARRISGPKHPMFFMKPVTALLGHLQNVEARPYYGSFHPEPELAVVIGRLAKDLDPHHALDYVAGYTILNDMTGNAMRAEDMVHYYALYGSKENPDVLERREQHLSYAARYKGTDGFAPLGPWLVTRDEVPDPNDLDVICKVGGEVVAEDSTRYLTYSVAEVLAFLSRFLTLEPGDVVSMGTAFRAADGAKRSLHTADLSRLDGPVEISISGLGTLVHGVSRWNGSLPDWRLPKKEN